MLFKIVASSDRLTDTTGTQEQEGTPGLPCDMLLGLEGKPSTAMTGSHVTYMTGSHITHGCEHGYFQMS
ncbi:hypothetical protein APTSU1_000896100 [Apodemus speciosus]|uniref:Uncharacterized protein n=1 Tax=Apodemus speciosus TaxID=105296 RepID=A0ABQ0F374_APOSI